MKVFLSVILIVLGLNPVLTNGEELRSKQGLDSYEKAIFAGGCFWCMQPPFDEAEGVMKTTVGYTGGLKENPMYEEVSYGKTGHCEAIEILYDSQRITYGQLLNIFWKNIDPTQVNGQFADIGSQYRTEIFYHSLEQKRIAEESKKKLSETKKFKAPIVTAITEASVFYPAEEYHQQYYKKEPSRYKNYKYGSGRQSFIEENWKNK